MWKDTITEVINYIDDRTKTTQKQVKDAVQAANDSPSRMESRYDSYREEYSMQAAAIGNNLVGLRLLREFLAGLLSGQALQNSNQIMLGALVGLNYGDGDDDEFVLLIPNSGGDHIEVSGKHISTVSIESPLGAALIGHKIGDNVKYVSDRRTISVQIVDILKDG